MDSLKKCKHFIIGLIIGCILFGIIPAFADSMDIKVVFNNIKLMVNGKFVSMDVEPLVYRNRTHVPVRFVAEALGKKVTFNKTTNTVEISDMNIGNAQMPTPTPEPIPTPTPTPTPEPIPTPEIVPTYQILDEGETYTNGDFSITLTSISEMENGIYRYIFDYENNSDERISKYKSIDVYDYEGNIMTAGGMLRDYPSDMNATFDYLPNSIGQRFFQMVLLDEFEYIGLHGTNVRWKVE